MAQDFFYILVHPNLLEALRKGNRGLSRAVQKTLERLQFGYWGNGTRVKLLKGVRRLVYEARVDRGTRLLFTVIRSPGIEPPHSLEPFILAWDVVSHDNVRRARRMNLVPETGFLDFDELASVEIETPPEAPEAEPLPEAATAEGITRVLMNPAVRRLEGEEVPSGIRWFLLEADVVADEAEWQRLLDNEDFRDLELKLSREQAEAVQTPGPVLLRGTAGSGKTTVGVYRLARTLAAAPRTRALYVTYSNSLRAYAEQLFRDLLIARRLEAPERPPEFLTFPELYQRLAGGAGSGAELLRFPLFERWYAGLFRRHDAALVWEEIRGIIKGACLEPDQDGLSFAEYRELGRKRAPLFANERRRIYKAFGKYERWRRDQGWEDDIDRARRALKAVRGRPTSRYDCIVCDEGQDLTEIEMLLLLELLNRIEGLMFAADPQQIVNPSGFRWAEIRSMLRDRCRRLGGPPEVRSLTRNYRSVHSVVALANALLRVQRARTGRSDDDEFQEAPLEGQMPLLVTGPGDAVVRFVRDFGPRCGIVTGSSQAARALREVLGSERIFPVPEAKGLEFDGCLLWNVFSTDLELWASILEGDEPRKGDPEARRAIHYAYVAVTRARRHLGVYEENPEAARLWKTPWFRGLIEQDAPEALAKFLLRAASPDEWRREGEYFAERERYRQAAECFRRAGDSGREKEMLARYHESIGEHVRAAELYRDMGDRAAAARCFERSGRPEQAAPLYLEIKHWERAAVCFERSGEFEQAAKAYDRARNKAEAQRCRFEFYRRTGNWLAAAEIARKSGDRAAAAKFYRRAGDGKRALNLELQALRKEQGRKAAAKWLEDGGELTRAAREYAAAGCPEDAARCKALFAEKKGQWLSAARFWSKAGDETRALRIQARYYESKQKWFEAALRYEALGRKRDIRRCLLKSDGKKALAWLEAMDHEANENYQMAAIRYSRAGLQAKSQAMLVLAAKQADRGNPARGSSWDAWEDEDIRESGRLLDEWEVFNRERMRERRQRLFKALESGDYETFLDQTRWDIQPDIRRMRQKLLMEHGDWEECAKEAARGLFPDYELAAKCYEKIGKMKQAFRMRAKQAVRKKDYLSAARWFKKCGNRRDAFKNLARYLEESGDFARAAAAYEKGRCPGQARRCRRRAGDAEIPEVSLDILEDSPDKAPEGPVQPELDLFF